MLSYLLESVSVFLVQTSERKDVFEATRVWISRGRVREKQHFGGEKEISSQHWPLVSVQRHVCHEGCPEVD